MSENEFGSFHWIYEWVPAVRTCKEVVWIMYSLSRIMSVLGASNHCCGCSDNPAQLVAVFPGTVWDRHSELRAPLCRGTNSGPVLIVTGMHVHLSWSCVHHLRVVRMKFIVHSEALSVDFQPGYAKWVSVGVLQSARVGTTRWELIIASL